MDSIDFNAITISKARPFKNIEGKYCFINYPSEDQDKLIVEFEGTTAFDINLKYDKPNVFIYLYDKVETFNKNIKESLVSLVKVNSRFIFGEYLELESLNDFYCNPHKVIQRGKRFIDVLKLKLNCTNPNDSIIPKNTKLKLKVHVSGTWFNKSSFGPYFNIVEFEKIEKISKSLFIEEPESDIEIN